jgi:hypothetical protein
MAAPNHQLQRARNDEPRPSIREYAIVLGVLALIAGVAFIVFGPQTETILSTVSGSV